MNNTEEFKYRKCKKCGLNNILIERTTKWRKYCKDCYYNPLKGRCFIKDVVKKG